MPGRKIEQILQIMGSMIFSFSDSTAYIIGNGTYTVWATDKHGCLLSAEKHSDYNGIYAKGTVTATGELYSNGSVTAYQKTADGFVFAAQTDITDGEFLFPATLSSGYYLFCAIPNENDDFLETYYGNKSSIEKAFVVNLSDYDGVVSLGIELLSVNSTSIAAFTEIESFDFTLYPNPVFDIMYLQLYFDTADIVPISIVVSYPVHSVEETLQQTETVTKTDK